jgi:hypothetical protein
LCKIFKYFFGEINSRIRNSATKISSYSKILDGHNRFQNIVPQGKFCGSIQSSNFLKFAAVPPLGLDAAKHKRKIGIFLEFISGNGFSATFSNMVLRHLMKNLPIVSKSASFTNIELLANKLI